MQWILLPALSLMHQASTLGSFSGAQMLGSPGLPLKIRAMGEWE